MTEIGQSSRQYCELAGRVEPVVGDLVMALVSMGITHGSLDQYAQRSGRHQLPTPSTATATKQTGILQTGQKLPPPSHIGDHLPPFPDSHAYVQTPVSKTPFNPLIPSSKQGRQMINFNTVKTYTYYNIFSTPREAYLNSHIYSFNVDFKHTK